MSFCTSCGSLVGETDRFCVATASRTVVDAWSRRVVGWSIADHLRTELVCDALDMACWRRKPPSGEVIHHADHGTRLRFKGVRSATPISRPVGIDGNRR